MTVRWSFLPFIGASINSDEREHEEAKESNDEDGNDHRFSHQETAAEFAQLDEEDVVLDYNAPISWWVSSSLFPLIAGTFGPMASAFNIMAVAIRWRTTISPLSVEAEGTFIPDPRWLIGVNAASLAIAIVANLALLAQMGGRLRFNIASPITIVGWFISGFIDIGLVAATPSAVPLPADQLSTYSQAYYYAIFAGALYVLLSAMLMVTAYGAWIGKHSTGFKLTMAQRSLMLQTMLFLGYVLAAGAVYTRIEDWIYLDACYFIVVTLFTIGLGDLTPSTHLGRGLEFPMAAGGIIFVGLIISNIRTLVIESASKKVSLRLLEKARLRALKGGEVQDGIIKVRGFQRRDMSAPTELERRENEFNIMREIQATAIADNRRLTLGLSLLAFCILWFIGAVIFWQAEKAPGGQNWTYFESLYFTYIAQLTIGYGDLAPQTNSGKAAFVFWALIALPTLTVLIGAVGDAASDFVNWSFVWIGRHSRDMVRLVKILSRRPKKAKDVVELAREETSNEKAEHAFSDIAHVDGGRVVPRTLEDGKAYNKSGQTATDHEHRCSAILRTAQRVLTHLDEEKSKKYSFDEWTWLLRLLGEDEGDTSGHRRLGTDSQAQTDPKCSEDPQKRRNWSWIGQESPLIDVQDGGEPRWVLRKLLHSLEEDIKRSVNSRS